MKEMIKQKMMKRLHRRTSSSSSSASAASVDFKSGEKVEFRFSSLQVLQVPKGWDKLSLSLVSVETGKSVTKTGKASVRNGNCRWTETLSESIWVSRDDPSKEFEQCLYKLLVSMGSARSGILGEVVVNLSAHLSSATSMPIALPLKNCSHGTILQVHIQCLNPRENLRNDGWMDTDSFAEDVSASDDLHNTSDVSDSRIAKNVGSSTPLHTSHAGSRGTSLSAGESHRSFDSMEDSFGRESCSPHSNLSEVSNDLIGRQDSAGFPNSALYSSSHVSDSPKSSQPPYTSSSGKHISSQRQDSGKVSHSIPASPLRIRGSSEFGLEAEGATVEELRAEARMWERNARKLMVDLDVSRKESRDQTRNLENVTMELVALRTECDGLKHEISHLKVLLDESAAKENAADNLKLQAQDKDDIQTELEEEIKYQKELNDDLSLQLNKTQESNLELVSVLQELEETIEKQRLEIESLSKSQLQEVDTGVKSSKEAEESEQQELELQLQKSMESQKTMENMIHYLEKALEEKTREIELERALKTQSLLDCESEWTKKLSLKEKEIFILEAKLSEAHTAQVSKGIESQSTETPDLIEEVKALKDKIQELERDCDELTDENLELLFKLKESSKDLPTTVTSINASSVGRLGSELPGIKDLEVLKLERQIQQLKEETKKRERDERAVGYQEIRCNDLESKCMELDVQMQVFKEKASYLDGELAKYHAKAEEQESEIAAMKQLLESRQEAKHENPFAQEKQAEVVVDNVKSNMVVLNSMDSPTMANKILEKKLLELESCNRQLELHLAEVEDENLHLSDRVSGLEPQLRYLTDARESGRLEAEHSETRVVNLQAEIRRLENEIETGKVDMRQKLQDMQKRWLEAQEECEYLKKANPKLQATAEDLIEECSSLQKSNRELRQQRLDLHNRCTILEAELRESQHKFSKLSKNLEDLEVKFSSTNNEIASKEKMFVSELDALYLQNKEQTEKLVMSKSLLNQKCLEKMVEVENLQQEVAHLSTQISATHDERDRMASGAVLETRVLRAEKDKLEKAIKDVEEKYRSSEKKLDTVQVEYETRILEVTGELAASKQSHGVMEANLEKLMDLLENTRSSEEKLRTTVGELEDNLKSCEYQRVQLTEEIESLKSQLQKIPLLLDEVVALKNSLNDVKYENERLEASLQLISGDCEELKEEKALLFQKTSSMQKAAVELEEHKRSKVVLEEKCLRLHGDLTAREALCAQDAELKNELGRLKRSNSQLQWKINRLQEDNDECLKKAQDLEEKLEQKKGLQADEIECSTNNSAVSFGSESTCSLHEDMKLSEDVEAGAIDEMTVDAASRIQSLENELAEALEANEMYKAQLNSFLAKGQVHQLDVPVDSPVQDETVNKEHRIDALMLEAELRELQERYLHMSLKYAEVEAQREELVLKLKAAGPGKRWFS